MAINFPGPGELRIFYQTAEPAPINQHVLRHSFFFNDDPPTLGDIFENYLAQRRGGGTTALDLWTDNLVDNLKNFYPAATDFTHAELWYYDSLSFDSVFVSTYTLGENGVSGTASVAASQTVISLRTLSGGIAKIDMRGTIFAPAPSQGFPTSTSAINTFATMLTNDNTIVIGRDDGFAFSPVKFLPGQNEKAWKRVNR